MSDAAEVTVLVIAKAPIAGRSKTRLCPPCTPEQAAEIAEAALVQTLLAVAEANVGRRVLVLDGEPGPWMPDGFDVVAQRGSGLDERLAAAFADTGGPALLIGMDTPQVEPSMLDKAVEKMFTPGVDAVLGSAEDGGWWAIGLHSPREEIFLDVPMSTPATAEEQRARLRSLGMAVEELVMLRDVDAFVDAKAVAEMLPGTPFARSVAAANQPPAVVDEQAEISPGGGRDAWVTWGVLLGWAALVIGVATLGEALRHAGLRTYVNAVPLTGNWDPRVSVRILPALALATAVIAVAPRAGDLLSWRRLLLAAIGGGAAWAALLALSDGARGLTVSAVSPLDYLPAVASIDSPATFLREFVDRIGTYPPHVRGHPPGLVLLLWVMDGVGLSGPWPLALLEVGAYAAVAPAALVALREVAGERLARAATPFAVLAPAAVAASSGDALFAAVGGWAVAFVVLATGSEGRRSDRLALAGGLLFGAGMYLSYGLVLLAIVPLAVATARRRGRPLVIASVGVVVVALLFLSLGFWWVEGLLATRLQYLAGIARRRPYDFFLLANLTAFALAAGPAAAVALAHLRDRRVWLLVGAGLAAVLVADLTGMSKGEVERIWLPFVPWVLLATCVLVEREQRVRGWLALQAACAIAIQVAVRSPW